MISLGCIHTVCFYDSQNEELQGLVKAPGFKTTARMSGCKFFICGKHNLM